MQTPPVQGAYLKPNHTPILHTNTSVLSVKVSDAVDVTGGLESMSRSSSDSLFISAIFAVLVVALRTEGLSIKEPRTGDMGYHPRGVAAKPLPRTG